MKRGVHKHLLQGALNAADRTLIFADENVQWDIQELDDDTISSYTNIDALIASILAMLESTDSADILIMSNGGFNNLYERLIEKLS